MHPPPNDRPAGKEEADSEKEHADFRQKRVLSLLRREKTPFKKAKEGTHHQFHNNREKYEIPKLLPSGPTGKRCVFFKRLEEVVHKVFLNSIPLLARDRFLQQPAGMDAKAFATYR
jgi:hypothetical protein